METKTYFASSVQAAMEVARRELGPDAMLVNSQPAVDAARSFGRLEVTFAWEPAAAAVPGKTSARSTGEAARGQQRPVQGETGLEDIRLEISALRAAIGRQTGSEPLEAAKIPAGIASTADPGTVETLCETGFDKDTARQIASAAATNKGNGNWRDAVMRELTARLPEATFSPLRPDESRTLAFVGPPGRGKTTSLIKVAIKYGLATRIPTRIFTAGAHGVGATEQMARYTAILGVPFQAIESFESLNLALQGERWKGLVLIDTPGLGSCDRQEAEGMTKFFSRRTDIESHLVLRAEACSVDMQYMLSRYAPIRPTRLLFTGLDEVRGLGAAADTMIRSGIAASFFGTGPQVPDDLEEVSVPKLARSLWTTNGMAARAA
jgi:flagellar biosynthesis protein FlhF